MDFKEEDLIKVKDILKKGKPIRNHDMHTLICDDAVLAAAVESMGVDLETYKNVCAISHLIVNGLRVAAAETLTEEDCRYVTAELAIGQHMTATSVSAENLHAQRVPVTTYRSAVYSQACEEATGKLLQEQCDLNDLEYETEDEWRACIRKYVDNLKENVPFKFGLPAIDEQYGNEFKWGSLNIILPEDKLTDTEVGAELIWSMFNHARRRWAVPCHREHLHVGHASMSRAVEDGPDVAARRLVRSLIHYDEKDIGASAVFAAVSIDFLNNEHAAAFYDLLRELRVAAEEHGVALFLVILNVPINLERARIEENADSYATLHDYADSAVLNVVRNGSEVFDVDPMERPSFYNKWAPSVNTY